MSIVEGLLEDPRLLYRHTVDEYHRMIEGGRIEEGAPFELLDGQIVRKLRNALGEDPMSISPDHSTAVVLLNKLDRKLDKFGCHMRTQPPVTLPPFNEPEPDGAIVRGTEKDYKDHHPGAADILCVIEVADASLRRDRGYKQQVYAGSGIPMYVIVNLSDRVVEVYTQPMKGKGRYGQSLTLTPSQSVTFPTSIGKGLVVPVRRLLP